MKYIYLIVLLLISVSQAGCATTSNVVFDGFSVKEYNEVASKFMDRPTEIEISKANGRADLLIVKYSSYAGEIENVDFAKDHVDEYVSLIDKYLKWERIATTNGDILYKKIGEAKVFPLYYLIFIFRSADRFNHFLLIKSDEENEIYLDKNMAVGLKSLLLKFKNGELHQTDESIYN